MGLIANSSTFVTPTILYPEYMKNIQLIILLTFFILLPVKAQEYDGEVLNHTSYIQASPSKLVRTDTITYIIYNRQAEHLTEFSLLYNKGEKVTIGDSWIEDIAGNIVRKLKKSDIDDLSAVSNSSLYDDRRVKTFSLKHNMYPYKVVLSYKVTFTNFFHIASWGPRLRVPTRNMKLVVEAPKDYPLRYKQENAKPPLVSEREGTLRIEWNTSYTPLKREVSAPLSELKIPQIEVAPLHFKYGVDGSLESWQTLGNWITKLNAKASDLPDSEKTKVDTMLSGITDSKEKINKLYIYLQDNTRYVNVSIKVGGLKSYPASYVAQNKYGDCKALCNYMQCLLKHAGIKSYYTLIQAGDEIEDIDMTFPMQAFNHVILTVPLENETVFLECTSRNTPMGYLGTFTQGRKALLVDGMNSRFITTPSLSPDDVLSTRHISIPMKQRIVTLDMNMNLRGEDYERFTYLESEVSRNDAERYIRNYVLSGNVDLTDVEFGRKSRNVASMNVSAKLKFSNVYRKMGNNILLTTFARNLPAYELPEKRTQTVQLDFPYHHSDTIVYQMPHDSQKITLPENISIQSKYGSYTVSYKTDNNQFIIEKHILIHSGIYPLEEYEAFYGFISEIKNNEKSNIYIN